MPAAAPAILALDRDGLPLDVAAKTCTGTGLGTLRRWLEGDGAEVLLLHNGRGEPLVLTRWSTWQRVARTVVRGAIPNDVLARAIITGALPNSAPEESPSTGYSPLARVR
jgi:hypothetical protein